jgi:hypothetical protein
MPFPVEGKWIAQTESKLGVRFPASFVTAMSKMNGGSVKTRVDQFELFPFLDGSDRKRIARTCGSIDRETIAAQPDTLEHVIYWWDHETREIEPVADDFGALKRI